MSWDFCNTSTPKAKKDYRCDACEWLINVGTDFLSDEECAIYESAKAEGFKIRTGSQYIKCEGMWDGEFSVFRARPDINEICVRHQVYRE